MHKIKNLTSIVTATLLLAACNSGATSGSSGNLQADKTTATGKLANSDELAAKKARIFAPTTNDTLLVYITAKSYTGNLGGYSGADAKCNDSTDSNYPQGYSHHFKAMLAHNGAVTGGVTFARSGSYATIATPSASGDFFTNLNAGYPGFAPHLASGYSPYQIPQGLLDYSHFQDNLLTNSIVAGYNNKPILYWTGLSYEKNPLTQLGSSTISNWWAGMDNYSLIADSQFQPPKPSTSFSNMYANPTYPTATYTFYHWPKSLSSSSVFPDLYPSDNTYGVYWLAAANPGGDLNCNLITSYGSGYVMIAPGSFSSWGNWFVGNGPWSSSAKYDSTYLNSDPYDIRSNYPLATWSLGGVGDASSTNYNYLTAYDTAPQVIRAASNDSQIGYMANCNSVHPLVCVAQPN